MPLNIENLGSAIDRMRAEVSHPISVEPTHLLVSPDLHHRLKIEEKRMDRRRELGYRYLSPSGRLYRTAYGARMSARALFKVVNVLAISLRQEGTE